MSGWMRSWSASIALAVLGLARVHAGCMDSTRLLGVNLSGAEFGEAHLPGVLDTDYMYPKQTDLTYFQQQGMNLVRLPIRWERIQHHLSGPLDVTEMAQIGKVVAWARQLNMCLLLDLHNFGAYHGVAVGTPQIPATALIDVWQRIHSALSDTNTVAFGLMNEPAAIPGRQWIALAQVTVLALRQAGVKNLLMVSSGRWSGAHEWEKEFDSTTAASTFHNFKDPLNNFAIELHQYADPDFSGTQTSCVEASRLLNILSRVTHWALRDRKRLFLGEFGVPNSPGCLAALDTLLKGTQNANAWLGWAYWSAGAWWGTYAMSIQPGATPAAAQLRVLQRHLPKPTAKN